MLENNPTKLQTLFRKELVEYMKLTKSSNLDFTTIIDSYSPFGSDGKKRF